MNKVFDPTTYFANQTLQVISIAAICSDTKEFGIGILLLQFFHGAVDFNCSSSSNSYMLPDLVITKSRPMFANESGYIPTEYPASANAVAMCFPIPRPDPVIRATRPRNLFAEASGWIAGYPRAIVRNVNCCIGAGAVAFPGGAMLLSELSQYKDS
jgi:hypothetical protein